jgi:hypothetical protein
VRLAERRRGPGNRRSSELCRLWGFHEIGRLKGFRVRLDQVFHLWFQYREPHYPPWLTGENPSV